MAQSIGEHASVGRPTEGGLRLRPAPTASSLIFTFLSLVDFLLNGINTFSQCEGSVPAVRAYVATLNKNTIIKLPD